jgi:hypothetical protein
MVEILYTLYEGTHEDKNKARMLIEEYIPGIVVTKCLYHKCLSFRQFKCDESHMTYLARNTVKGITYTVPVTVPQGSVFWTAPIFIYPPFRK